jgi:SAM-dependent methyltransferase
MAEKFYDQDLAELHNLYYSDFVENAAPGAVAAVRAAGIRSGVVLDLGCGGGQLSSRLLGEGYQPVGIDVSAAMVRLAQKRVPGAKFVRGSIAEVCLPSCAAAVAIGEVFNYLPSTSSMTRAFRNVFYALRPGGALVFDIKEPLPGPGTKIRTAARWGEDWAIFVEVTEDPGKHRLVRKIVSFRKVGRYYRRQYEVHRQIILKAAEIVKMLEAIGFSVVARRGYRDFRLSDDRRVLIGRKTS